MTVAQLKKAVGELEKSRGKMQARLTELDAHLKTAPAGELVGLTAELTSTRRALAVVDERVIAARAELKEAKRARIEVQVAKLRKKEAAVWADAEAMLLGPVREKMDELASLHQELAKCGAGPHHGPATVYETLAFLRYWRCQETGDYSDYPH